MSLTISVVRVYAAVAFTVLWVVVGYGDWQRQKIQHRLLRWGVYAAALGYGVLAVNTALGCAGRAATFHMPPFYLAVLAHVALCVLLAFLFWSWNIWPAGDVKLFILLSFFYPLLAPASGLNRDRVFLVVLINIFLPCAAFLFLRAVHYIFDTRLRHSRDFLASLGWRKELGFLWDRTAAAAGESWSAVLLRLKDPRIPAPSELLKVLPLLLQWLSGMASMAVLSYYLHDHLSSPFLLSLLCMGVFYLWSSVKQRLGETAAKLLPVVVLLALLAGQGVPDWRRLAALMGNISVFSFFMFLGVQWAVTFVNGGARSLGMLLPMVLPFVIYGLMNLLQSGVRVVWGFLRQITLVHRPVPMLALTLPYVPAAWRPGLETTLQLALLGLFFGLSLVLVRRWDDEVRPSQKRSHLSSYLVLAPSMLEKIRADEEFAERHFSTTYADGLTSEQAEALKAWCEEKGIEDVPLAPTMSFASWIFFGYMLAAVSGGGHVLQVLF